MEKTDFGMIGMAVMGSSLALNIESRGFSVSAFNITYKETEEFLQGKAKGKNIQGFRKIKEFVESLKKPRKIMLMIMAGAPVDSTIELLIPLLDKGDIIIDGGNSFFKDTIRRDKYLTEKGFRFIGTGVSGGEEGALKGPALMPGGAESAYKEIEPIFTAISAKVDDNPCCSYIGNDGAGHYVKMIHNGIEYGDMQLISEAYYMMKHILKMSNDEMHECFADWNKGELDSYLIEITSEILTKKSDGSDDYILDIILDKAGQKGTGKWTSQNALDLGISTPTITEAVYARCISAVKEERIEASKILSGPEIEFQGDKKEVIESIRQALYAAKICSYAQGFALMREAGKEYKWDLDFGSISMLWRGGCIIRAQFLHKIKDAFDKDSNLSNLMLDDYFNTTLKTVQGHWRDVIKLAVDHGIPTPAFSSALAYYDSYRRETLPANMIQAQRDYFGAHTYKRIDKEGTFHTEWQK